jgi:hypothetical protein
MVTRAARDADAARLGQRFEAAAMLTPSPLMPMRNRRRCSSGNVWFAGASASWIFTAQSTASTTLAELRQHAVDDRAGDTAMVGIDELIDDRQVRGQAGQSCCFAALHVPAVTLDVGGKPDAALPRNAPSPCGW